MKQKKSGITFIRQQIVTSKIETQGPYCSPEYVAKARYRHTSKQRKLGELSKKETVAIGLENTRDQLPEIHLTVDPF